MAGLSPQLNIVVFVWYGSFESVACLAPEHCAVGSSGVLDSQKHRLCPSTSDLHLLIIDPTGQIQDTHARARIRRKYRQTTDHKMHVTACLAGQKEEVEVGEDCRSLRGHSAVLPPLATPFPKDDNFKQRRRAMPQ